MLIIMNKEKYQIDDNKARVGERYTIKERKGKPVAKQKWCVHGWLFFKQILSPFSQVCNLTCKALPFGFSSGFYAESP